MFSVRSKWLVLALALLAPLGFAAFTGHAWEDYFITLRVSRNLAEGHGLVFNRGQPLHTFTSPLGVLLPALCTWIVGPGREEFALWLFRFVSAGLLGAGALLVWRRATELKLGRVGFVTLFGLLIFDAKLTDFSINGMETAILVCFTLLLWSELEATGGPRVGVLALAVGGLMWTRPDAFILGGVLIIARVTLRANGEATRRKQLPVLVRGIVLGGLIYVPWFAWAWWYYGTPVPHTIIAKSAFTPAVHVTDLLLVPWHTLTGESMLVDLFMPSYWTFGGWPVALKHLAHALAGIAAFAWLSPRLPIAGRRASLAVFLGMFYVCSIILFPWYVPPWSVLATIAIAFAIDGLHAAAMVAQQKLVASLVRVACILFVAAQGATWLATAWQMQHQQQLVETPVRHAIGEWLHANAAPDDTLFLEPLGYIGYFSQLRTFDHPGLSSPEVVAAVRGGARRFADVIGQLKLTWVVLRPSEAARPEFNETGVLRDYTLIRSWDSRPLLDEVEFLPGRPWMELEARYLVFRRK